MAEWVVILGALLGIALAIPLNWIYLVLCVPNVAGFVSAGGGPKETKAGGAVKVTAKAFLLSRSQYAVRLCSISASCGASWLEARYFIFWGPFWGVRY